MIQLCILLACIVCSITSLRHQFQDISNYREHNLDSKRISDHLVSLIEEYKQSHNRAILTSESLQDFCSRKFLLSRKFSCKSVGNGIGSLLSDFLAAIITNRTFVWASPNPWPICQDYLSLDNDWIPLYDDIKLAGTKCQYKSATVTNSDPSRCNFSNFQSLFVTPYSGYNQIVYKYMNRFYDSELSDFAHNKSRILFKSTFDDNSRFSSYGAAFAVLGKNTSNFLRYFV